MIKGNRLFTPQFFGLKWYPMTMKPALPFVVTFSGWYWVMCQLDKKVKGGHDEH
ncbi:hypothetical protein MP228_000979 [Amoeboaphelidium protococcarum]|nr:hypothetical protein MP228_002773 [Amoeboaphelidium protococcarum]KAI3654260.1 hypothetical protein MP228_000979 [Amoeboaphelidium protococcarum]